MTREWLGSFLCNLDLKAEDQQVLLTQKHLVPLPETPEFYSSLFKKPPVPGG